MVLHVVDNSTSAALCKLSCGCGIQMCPYKCSLLHMCTVHVCVGTLLWNSLNVVIMETGGRERNGDQAVIECLLIHVSPHNSGV